MATTATATTTDLVTTFTTSNRPTTSNRSTTTVIVTATATSSPPTPVLSSSSSSSGLSVGAIVGIVIGTLVLLIALGVLLFWFYRRQTRPPSTRYRSYGDKARQRRSRPDTSPRAELLYEPLEYPQTHTRDVSSSVSEWLQRQPSKYSAVSLYPARTEDWQHEPLPSGPSPNKVTLSEFPALAIPEYQPSPSIISQNAHISVVMSIPPVTARSDSMDTGSVYSQTSETAQLSPVTPTSPPPPTPTANVASASTPTPRPRLLDDESYDTHRPLQLSPTEEPQGQLERGNTRVISHLLLNRTKRENGLQRNSSTVSHIEKEGEIREESLSVDANELGSQRRHTPAWARTNQRAPRSSFDVDLPAGLELSRTT